LIYGLASNPRFRDPAHRWLDWYAAQSGALAVTSRLTVLETLIGPIKKKDPVRQRNMETALNEVLILDLDDAVVRRAATIRAAHRFKTPDALHLATAVEAHADIDLTADRRLQSFREVRVVDIARKARRPSTAEVAFDLDGTASVHSTPQSESSSSQLHETRADMIARSRTMGP